MCLVLSTFRLPFLNGRQSAYARGRRSRHWAWLSSHGACSDFSFLCTHLQLPSQSSEAPAAPTWPQGLNVHVQRLFTLITSNIKQALPISGPQFPI